MKAALRKKKKKAEINPVSKYAIDITDHENRIAETK